MVLELQFCRDLYWSQSLSRMPFIISHVVIVQDIKLHHYLFAIIVTYIIIT